MPVRGDGREAFDVFRRGRIRVGVEAVTILDNEVQVGMGVNMHCHSSCADEKVWRTCIPIAHAEDSLAEG